MLQSEVINKLSRECCLAMGDFTYFKTIRTYIQMALAVGVDHYTTDMEEVVAMDFEGKEAGRFKSIKDAANELNFPRQNIVAVLHGRRPSYCGLKFMKVKDYELVRREPERGIKIIPLK
jgi:hypothetical protein